MLRDQSGCTVRDPETGNVLVFAREVPHLPPGTKYEVVPEPIIWPNPVVVGPAREQLANIQRRLSAIAGGSPIR